MRALDYNHLIDKLEASEIKVSGTVHTPNFVSMEAAEKAFKERGYLIERIDSDLDEEKYALYVIGRLQLQRNNLAHTFMHTDTI